MPDPGAGPSAIGFVPAPGDILWCAFPEHPRDRSAPPIPGPPHPVLVLTVYDQCKPLELLILPASTKASKNPQWVKFDVVLVPEDPLDFEPSGLRAATRFKGSSLDRLPFTSDLFLAAPDFSDPTAITSKPTCKMGIATPRIQKLAREAYQLFCDYVAREKARRQPRG